MTNENISADDRSAAPEQAPAAPARRTRARRATTGVTTPASATPDAPVEVEPTAATKRPARTRGAARGARAGATGAQTDAPATEDLAAAAAAPVETPAASAPAETQQTVAKAPRSRSRRATAPVTEPGSDAPRTAEAVAPAAPEASTQATTAAVAPAQASAAGSEETTARPRRSRRATSGVARAGAPAHAAPEAQATSEVQAPAEAATTPQEAVVTGEAASAAAGDEGSTRPSRRRGTRSGRGAAAAPLEVPAATDEPSVADATDGEAAAPVEAPSETARRGRGGRRRQEPTLDVFAALGADRPAPVSDPGAAAEDDAETEGDAEDAVEETPRRPATALLFQAPEPTSRPRRRRAQAPAGPPRLEDEHADAAVPDEESVEDDVLDLTDATAETDETPGADTDADEPADDDEQDGGPRRRRRRGGRGRRSRSGAGDRADAGEGDDAHDGEEAPAGRGRGTAAAGDDQGEQDDRDDADEAGDTEDGEEGGSASSRRRRRRRRATRGDGDTADEPAGAATSGRTRSRAGRTGSDEVTALKGSTRLEAKRQRRREGRDAGRRRTIVTEAEFLARREAVERSMIVRESQGRVQIAVLEDGVLVEHFVSRSAQNGQSSMAGNVYLGRVQNVLPSMEAAFVDVGKGRNAVLYAGEVNWDAAGLEGQPRRIEQALKSGDSVLVQVTKDPIGHKGARLTSQITLAGRYLVYVPSGGMTGISRKLPENERARLKKLLKEIVPDAAGVIVRTAAEGASEDELRRDVQRLQDQWAAIEKKVKTASAPALLQGEPDMAIRVVRDIFNDDFSSLVVQGDDAWSMISEYVSAMAPDLAPKVSRWTGSGDVFGAHRIDEQLAKGMDRKVWLPSGGSLVIDRTEAMTVVDVNTGKFTGSGGTLEETVTRNNLEAAEEIVRQLRLRDIGGIIVIDFIDMVLESNRDLVLRRLVECLGRDRTKHQVAEVTSLGLVQMTRKRVGQGLVEAFSETCEHCNGRGFIVHSEPVDKIAVEPEPARPTGGEEPKRSRRKKGAAPVAAPVSVPVLPEAREAVKATLATIAAAAAHAHEHAHDDADHDDARQDEAEHGDVEHSDAGQGDVEQSDVEHSDAEHSDVEHSDVEQSDAEQSDEPADAGVDLVLGEVTAAASTDPANLAGLSGPDEETEQS